MYQISIFTEVEGERWFLSHKMKMSNSSSSFLRSMMTILSLIYQQWLSDCCDIKPLLLPVKQSVLPIGVYKPLKVMVHI